MEYNILNTPLFLSFINSFPDNSSRWININILPIFLFSCSWDTTNVFLNHWLQGVCINSSHKKEDKISCITKSFSCNLPDTIKICLLKQINRDGPFSLIIFSQNRSQGILKRRIG